jgi:hemin uptake protein HemP
MTRGLPTMSDYHETTSAKEASSAQTIASANPVTIESGDLFRGQREILIQHGDEIYRLRITRNEKLILHK